MTGKVGGQCQLRLRTASGKVEGQKTRWRGINRHLGFEADFCNLAGLAPEHTEGPLLQGSHLH